MSTRDQAVVLERGPVSEIFTASADGIRQDFIVNTRPPGQGKLNLTLHLEGATARQSGESVLLTLPGKRELAYHSLKVTDAGGKLLEASLTRRDDHTLAIAVQDAGAIYPLTLDPTISDADWQVWNLGSGMNGYVKALAVSGSTLYAGGSFTTAGGTAANYIALWNGSAWSALGSGMSGAVNALAVSGSTLYAGGSFTTAGGFAVNRIAKWNGSAWSALGSGMDNTVSTLVVSGTTLYAGGDFTTAGGVTVNRIAQWDGSVWSALGSGTDNTVYALAVTGGRLYVCGRFITAGNKFSPYAATVSLTTPTSIALGSSLNPATFGQSVTLTATVTPSAATGTVTFKDGGSVLGTSPLSGGSATYINNALSVGSHDITAVYAGDSAYSGSTSSTLTQTINKADTTTAVISSLNPSTVGDSVTFTATVSPAATGTVEFFDGTVSLGTETLNVSGSGQATVNTSALTTGSHSITGVYSGNAAYNNSTSPVLTQTVNNPNVNISVATSPTGLTIVADGASYTAPQTFSWTQGSSHTLAISSSPQAGGAGTRYAFGAWSDGGAQSHTITVSASPTTYTANFGTEYQLTTGAGANGSVSPVSGSWYAAGSTPTISATANSGYAFDVWTLGSGSGPIANPTSASTTVTMNGPNTVSASFKVALSAAITGKSGTYNGLRTWSITVTNTGSATVSAAELDSFTISMSGLCQPVAKTSFPVSLGDISPGGSQTGTVSVDFTGCKKLAKFNVTVGYSANGGAASGTTPMAGVEQ